MNEPPSNKGLKRLSLTPGAPRTLSLAVRVASPTPDSPATPSPLGHGKRIAPKRLSTISYYNSTTLSSPSPTSSTNANAFARSPPPPTIPESYSQDNNVFGSRRSASLPRRTQLPQSPSDNSPVSSSSPSATAVPPTRTLTLAEKHSDLLTFIAQKESKCLELREQLAQHDAELAGLKRKWERIVARSAESLNAIVSAPSPESSEYMTIPSPSAGTDSVVASIRDGVQGLGRMLVMGGLGTPVTSTKPSPSAISVENSKPTPSHQISRHVYSSSTASTSRTASTSSITIASPPASTASTGRASLSSMTTASSDGDDISDDQSRPSTFVNDGAHTPKLDSRSHIRLDSSNGTTPSNSPTSFPPLASTEVQPDTNPMTPARSPRDEVVTTLRRSSPILSDGVHTRGSSINLAKRLHDKSPSRLTTPTVQGQSSSWVPVNLNKKWEEIAKTDTFSKSSKRASVLFSDMTSASSSFLGSWTNVLASPTPLSPTDSPVVNTSNPQSSPVRYFPLTNLAASPQMPNSNQPLSVVSLLDDDDDHEEDSTLTGGLFNKSNMATLSPVIVQPSLPAVENAHRKSFDDIDEDWNW